MIYIRLSLVILISSIGEETIFLPFLWFRANRYCSYCEEFVNSVQKFVPPSEPKPLGNITNMRRVEPWKVAV